MLYVDDDYVRWLHQNHPHSLPGELRIGATINVHSTPIALTKNLSSHRGVALTPIPHNSSDPLQGPSQLHTHSDSPMSGHSFTSSFRSTRKTFSEISQFLSIPSSVIKRSVSKGKGKERSVSGARVLTSEVSLALMLEKVRQKKEEEQAKQRRKLEREEKRLAKEKEKEIKTAERRSKAEEKKRIAELKKNEQVEKCKQREERRKQSGSRKQLERLDRSADEHFYSLESLYRTGWNVHNVSDGCTASAYS